MEKQEYKNPLRDKNGKFLFTKELKENWLKALRSGKYTQYANKLRNPKNHSEMCCLGVLADIHPNLRISKEGYDCVLGNQYKFYHPFNDMGIRANCKVELAQINDISYFYGIRDYSKVIPLIEQLETID